MLAGLTALAVAANVFAAPSLPPETTVLAAPRAGYVLPGCSRVTAGPVDGGWDPSDADIADMEVALASTLGSLGNLPVYSHGTESPDPLTYVANDPRWQREIIGIIRAGRPVVYGNYLPADIDVNSARLPSDICDGGPIFFGVEYDLATGTITHLSFNGGLGGPFWPTYAP
ncbi:hypothetical protein EKN06_01535 [Croceicoccus ponticola]|uniref:Uncharacterized protein n=1 Tax=Croceicoccus ponticola TaxID=2217664 RepID=A0A437H058_9SPHN|nr:hypothetical protein [Croceicoccus ponticola]RVQ68932.1 hypothetical protein EKN06_01535 [Croceicoccus ponticola]